MKAIVHLLRYLVGVLFIFSGAVKAIDPIGTGIKMEEYFTVFTEYLPALTPFWELLADYALGFSVFMVALEMVLGISLLLGTFFNLTIFLLFAMLLFFTILTGFTLATGKVTDCGCFGDFLKLEPIETFTKDIVLTSMVAFIWLMRDKLNRFRNPQLNVFLGLVAVVTLAMVVLSGYGLTGSLVIVAILGLGGLVYGYIHTVGLRPNVAFISFALLSLLSIAFTFRNVLDLPIVDFRAYKIGTNLIDCTSTEGRDPGERQIFYQMKNLVTGDVSEVESKEYISSGIWKDTTMQRVEGEQREVVIREAELPPCKDFYVFDEEGGEIQSEILREEGVVVLVSSYDVDKGSEAGFARVADWVKQAKAAGGDVYGLTGSSIERAEAKAGGGYDFYNLDSVPIKTMNRSNPGVTVVVDGVIVGKYHHNHLPDEATF